MYSRRDILNLLEAINACESSCIFVRSYPETATGEDLWNACNRPDWITWFLLQGTTLTRWEVVCRSSRVLIPVIEPIIRDRMNKKQAFAFRELKEALSKNSSGLLDVYTDVFVLEGRPLEVLYFADSISFAHQVEVCLSREQVANPGKVVCDALRNAFSYQEVIQKLSPDARAVIPTNLKEEPSE